MRPSHYLLSVQATGTCRVTTKTRRLDRLGQLGEFERESNTDAEQQSHMCTDSDSARGKAQAARQSTAQPDGKTRRLDRLGQLGEVERESNTDAEQESHTCTDSHNAPGKAQVAQQSTVEPDEKAPQSRRQSILDLQTGPSTTTHTSQPRCPVTTHHSCGGSASWEQRLGPQRRRLCCSTGQVAAPISLASSALAGHGRSSSLAGHGRSCCLAG